MYCQSCGARNDDGAYSCVYCGKPLASRQADGKPIYDESASAEHSRTQPQPSSRQPTHDYYNRQVLDIQTYYPNSGLYPPRIATFKWNWGAFLLPLFWGLSHKQMWTLLIFVPYVGSIAALIFSFMFGASGWRIAWDSGRFHSEDECLRCQSIWFSWGIALLIINFVLCVVLSTIYAAAILALIAEGGSF